MQDELSSLKGQMTTTLVADKKETQTAMAAGKGEVKKEIWKR